MSLSDLSISWDLLVSEASKTSVSCLENFGDCTRFEGGKSELARADKASQTFPCDTINDSLLAVTNLQNQQFGAGMAQNLGAQGVSNMQAGQGMMNTGIGMAAGAGDQQRAYDQQLLGNQYQQGMAPYNSLNFYNSVVGAPNNLSTATASSKGSSSSIGMSFG